MRSSRIRVCMLISDYGPDSDRTASQLGGVLDRLDRERFAPFVLTRLLDGDRSAGMEGHTPVIRRPAPLGALSLLFSTLRYLWLRRREYDVVHVHSLDLPALAGAHIKRLFRHKKYIQHIPGSVESSQLDRLTKTAAGRSRLRFMLKYADAVHSPCSEAVKIVDSLGLAPDRISLIPDGVDDDFCSPPSVDEKRVLKRSFGIAEDAFTAIVVSRLYPRHNVMSALRAWTRVVESHPGSSLIVAGGGPEGPRLAEHAETQFAGRSVIFTGSTSREEVARLMKTADVYLSYSASEGNSDAMLEAMSSGLPVVAPHSHCSDQLVDHTGTGLLFDPKLPMDGAEYLVRLAEDPDLVQRMSDAVRRVVRDHYSFERIAQRVGRLYLDESDTPGDRFRYNKQVPKHAVNRNSHAERENEIEIEAVPVTATETAEDVESEVAGAVATEVIEDVSSGAEEVVAQDAVEDVIPEADEVAEAAATDAVETEIMVEPEAEQPQHFEPAPDHERLSRRRKKLRGRKRRKPARV